MRVILTRSATKHGLDSSRILYAMAHAVIHERGHRGAADPDVGRVDLLVGPTPEGVLIEVLAELRADDLVVFHAMPITRRRLQQMNKERGRR